MKKIILSIALLTSAIVTFAGPENKYATMVAEKNMSASIRSQIHFPEFLMEKEGEHKAAIIFKLTGCGTIAVQEIQSDDADLKVELLNQVPAIKVNTAGLDIRDTYKVVVRFEAL
jgi:hypothetical protein